MSLYVILLYSSKFASILHTFINVNGYSHLFIMFAEERNNTYSIKYHN